MKSDYFLASDDANGEGNDKMYEFVRDEDVEVYLRGLLWILRMYADGVCADISYSFAGRTSPTPSRIVRYLAAHTDDALLGRKQGEVDKVGGGDVTVTTEYLQGVISVPVSSMGSLSAEATSACVIPREGQDFISPKLRGVWASLQSSLHSDRTQVKDQGLHNLSYETVVEKLKEVWDTSAISDDVHQKSKPMKPSIQKSLMVLKSQKRVL